VPAATGRDGSLRRSPSPSEASGDGTERCKAVIFSRSKTERSAGLQPALAVPARGPASKSHALPNLVVL